VDVHIKEESMMNWTMRILLTILFFNSVMAYSFIPNSTKENFAETFEISSGHDHICAITTLGIKCFGNSERLTIKSPSPGTNPRSLKTGNKFSCLILDEGIRCWGDIPNSSESEILIGKKSLDQPKLLSVGYQHACGVSKSDQIKCWGNGEQGETKPPLNLKNISELSLGMNNSCVIANKRVVCWGKNVNGSTDVPQNLVNPRNLTSGWWHHCALTDRGIKCWGFPYTDIITINDPSIKEFASGGLYNCAITPTAVKCWDELGKANLVEESSGAYKISVGSSIACAMTTKKGVICWRFKLSGNGKYKLLKSFVPSGGILDIDRISAGQSSTCAFGDSGNLKCWGVNADGALDVPSTVQSPISHLSVGSHKTCVIRNGKLSCWGDTDSTYSTPPNLGEVSFVSSGGNQVCAGNKDKIKCWGDNMRGGLNMPLGLTNISQVSSGFTHVCVVANNQVSCWGGEEVIKNVNPITPIINPRSICAGGTFSCAITESGTTKCWGDKIDYSDENRIPFQAINKILEIPKEVQEADVSEISCGLNHACALFDGMIRCWGDDEALESKRLTVPNIKNPRNLSAGWNHTCALGDLGLSCWGDMLNLEMPDYSLVR
jgi:hypothetical protein